MNIKQLIQIITLAAATLSSCQVAHAAQVQPITANESLSDVIHSACSSVSNLAGSVMSARQVGVPLKNMMNIAMKNDNAIMKAMLEEAYELPRFSTKEYQQKSETDFSNKWYLDCYKSNSKK